MPIQIESPRLQSQSPIVGIDLGTTHSLISWVRDGKPEILNTREGERLLPSVVSFGSNGIELGYQAKRRKITHASETIFSVKRLLGQGFEDVKDQSLPYRLVAGEGAVKIQTGERAYSAVEISAIILRELKSSAEKALGQPVTRAVITVPAYFNDSQRQATRTAGRLAGLEVLRIINEPTAAALAYGLNQKNQGLIAVYDLGGGTFDLSILRLQDGIFEVLATHGNTTLGGDDLDRAIARVAEQDLQEEHGIVPGRDLDLLANLLEEAERVKIRLAEEPTATYRIDYQDIRYERAWTRQEFEERVRPLLEKTRESCLLALKDAGIQAEDLTDVVLVGGPTRLPIVQQVAEEIFQRKPNTSLHPDEVVAVGAAIQADILAGNNKDFLLLDVVPLSLGIETYGGLTSILIPRNTRIPTSAREQFTTFVDNQTGVDIHIVQGERERTEDNRSLGKFKLKGIRPMPAGNPRIEVTFLIDADGILQVAAKDLLTGNEQSIEVKPSYGLTDEEVERMLLASMENAESDIQLRELVEAKNKAEPVLRAAETKLKDAHRLLEKEEALGIEEKVSGLRGALEGKSVESIQLASRELNQSTIRLAELLLQEAMNVARSKNKGE